jgi:hypothetical protein
MISLNVNDIGEPRDEIPHHLPDILEFMSQKGWKHSLSTDGRHQYIYIGFSTGDRWHDRATLATDCFFGFREKRTNAKGLVELARRSAELCLTVYDTFVDVIPSNVNAKGVITENPFINKEPFSNESYDEFKARHQDKEFTIRERNKNLLATSYMNRIVVKNDDVVHLISDIENVNQKLAGTSAVTP